MKKFFLNIDSWLNSTISILLGIAMAALAFIINLQVIARYVLKISLGGIEELPVILMIQSVWLAAILVSRNDDHFKIDLLDMVVKNKKSLAIFKIFIKFLTFVVISVFAYLAFSYVKGTFEMNDVTAGLAIPLWILQAVIPFSTSVMAIYYARLIFKEIKVVQAWH